MPSTSDKRQTYRQLHEAGCFVLPNPWDIGTTRYLQHLGFKALATTSAGFAFSQALPDGAVGLDLMLAHVREIAAATELPVNVDFENGYADAPEDVAANVRLCVDTGVAGLSIEDGTGRQASPLYDIALATERMRAARAAIDATGTGVVLTGRAECFLVGRPDLDETIARLKAYAEAGADCLYAPGLRTKEQVAAVVAAVAPKPVNVLVAAAGGFTVAELAALGVRRVSVGGALARAAWTGFVRAARGIAENGTFDGFADTVSHAELGGLFRDDLARRTAP
jgi:2-methylisocitrate lyase-like PEP mutase family enzyme